MPKSPTQIKQKTIYSFFEQRNNYKNHSQYANNEMLRRLLYYKNKLQKEIERTPKVIDNLQGSESSLTHFTIEDLNHKKERVLSSIERLEQALNEYCQCNEELCEVSESICDDFKRLI